MAWADTKSSAKTSISTPATAYYARAGKTLCQLLCVGNKTSQAADIKNAHAIWKELNPPARKRVARGVDLEGIHCVELKRAIN